MKKSLWLKLCLTVVFCLCLAASGFCETTNKLTLDEFEMGGIGIGDSLNKVVEKYGLPTKQSTFDYNRLIKGYIYKYGDDLLFEAIPKSDGGTSVIGIISKNPKMSTPSGFAVGRSYKEVVIKYGVVAKTPKSKLNGNDTWLGMMKGYSFYDYYAGPFCMRFNVNDKGIIKAISFEAYE